MWRGI